MKQAKEERTAKDCKGSAWLQKTCINRKMSVASTDLNTGERGLGITTNEALQKLAIFTQFYKHVT